MTEIKLEDVDFIHNTDLDPADDYVASRPRVRAALRFPELIKVFTAYDAVANHMQRVFRQAGSASLWIGGIALVGIAAELLVEAFGGHAPEPVSVAIEMCAVISIVLALGPWVSRRRSRWLAARFVTEQIRQWHFQMFLDGELISLAHSAPAKFEAERSRRWAQFMAAAPNAEGSLHSFVDGEAPVVFHPQTPYTDAATAEQALGAYVDLRLKKELAYFQLKREEFADLDDWSETVARWTIFLALLLTGAQLVLVAARRLGWAAEQALWPAHRAMLAAALVLVVISASVRVYRSAVAVAQQRERYHSKWARLVALEGAWSAAPGIEEKLAIIQELERVEVEEMRGFLRDMRRSSYLL